MRSVADLPRGPHRRGEGDDGTGLIGAVSGLAVFLALLLSAMQLVVGLQATSATTGVAFDGAHLVAAAPAEAEHAARTEAEGTMRRLLGRFGERLRFDWSGSGPDVVVLRVRGPLPHILPPSLAGPLGYAELDRTVRVQRERWA